MIQKFFKRTFDLKNILTSHAKKKYNIEYRNISISKFSGWR